MDDELDLLLYVSTKEIFQKAATRQSVYKILTRISLRMAHRYGRHLNKEEKQELYDIIRDYRKKHRLTVERGLPKQREDQSMYEQPKGEQQ